MPVPRSAAPAGLKAVDHSCILRRRVKTSLERPDRDARIARRPGVPSKSRILMAGHSLAVYDERDFAGCFSRGAVAQLGERRVRNAKVEGSIPFRSTIKFQGFRRSLAGCRTPLSLSGPLRAMAPPTMCQVGGLTDPSAT